jgi:hypothetical protein
MVCDNEDETKQTVHLDKPGQVSRIHPTVGCRILDDAT